MVTANNYGLFLQQKNSLVVHLVEPGRQKNKHGLTGLMLFLQLKSVNYLLWGKFINKIVNTNTYTKNIISKKPVLDCKYFLQKYLFGEKSNIKFCALLNIKYAISIFHNGDK
jgi:hypothetical protein